MSHRAPPVDDMLRIGLGSYTLESPAISSKFIIVEVGAPQLSCPHRDTFLVPRAHLTRSSLYLRTRLASPHTTTIELPDVEVPPFTRYLYWLDNACVDEPTFYRLASLFALATHLQDFDFSRTVLRDIIDLARETHSYPEPDDINTIYGASEEGSGARKLLTDFYVHSMDQEWLSKLESAKEMLNQDYIDQVSVALAAMPKDEQILPWGKLPWVRDASAYLWNRGEDRKVKEYDTTSSEFSGDRSEIEEDDDYGEDENNAEDTLAGAEDLHTTWEQEVE